MRGISLMGGTDFSNFQFEISIFLLFILFSIMSIWVIYDSDKYFDGIKRHLFWPLTLITGPIGLGIYLFMRRKVDY
jgi:TM2 domain-containing membrane protein YozV